MDGNGHCLTQVWRQCLDKVIETDHARPIVIIQRLAYLSIQGALYVVLDGQFVQKQGFLLETGKVLVHVLEDRGESARYVGEDDNSNDHERDTESPLKTCVSRVVSISDRGHGRDNEIVGKQVLVIPGHQTDLRLIPPLRVKAFLHLPYQQPYACKDMGTEGKKDR